MTFNFSEWWIVVILVILSIPALIITGLIYRLFFKKKGVNRRLTFTLIFLVSLFVCYLTLTIYHNIKTNQMRQRVYEMEQLERR